MEQHHRATRKRRRAAFAYWLVLDDRAHARGTDDNGERDALSAPFSITRPASGLRAEQRTLSAGCSRGATSLGLSCCRVTLLKDPR